MSGHNRWTKIKHKKAAQGAAKGKLFTTLIKEITVAALEGRFKLGARRVAYLPKDPVQLHDPDRARSVLKLVDALDELDDVQSVHANFEIPDALLDTLGQG